MAISSSLYSSISGLSTMGEAMSVLGDNIANVNTVAFKSSTASFQDVLSESVATASGGSQVGRGCALSTVSSLFAQGSFNSSSSPTDMAIGGQGFFMLRSPDSSSAALYSRAGQFTFDSSGNLVNPSGDFVQGWNIDAKTGQASGTIGDITIGKNTPPVATTTAEVIANLDASQANLASPDPLYENWNGTNVSAVNPTPPIDPSKYDYSTSVKIYDSKGASHDLTVYYDRTTQDNQWQYLVTCDPSEDMRVMTPAQQAMNPPDTQYNDKNDKGAGALQYGTIQFDTSGNISQVQAYNVPPDGEVDPAKSDNMITLASGDSYFSFPTNFTGADTNQQITLNLGAKYDAKSSTQNQVLVSDGGARVYGSGGDLSQSISSATTWAQVSDNNGHTMSQGDTFIVEGYNNASDPESLTYTVSPANTVQDFLTALDNKFGCTATIDAQGRLSMADNTSGKSSMYITRFETISANGSTPFGGGTPISSAFAMTPAGITSDSATQVTNSNTVLTTLQGTTGPKLQVGDTFTFSGTDVDGNPLPVTAVGPPATTAPSYTVAAGDTIQTMLNNIAAAYGGASSGAKAVLGQNGQIVVEDLLPPGANGTKALSVSMAFTSLATPPAAPALPANPFGLVDTAPATLLTPQQSTSAEINITTSKKMVISTGRALSTNTGATIPITAATSWNSVYDDNSDPTVNGGLPRGLSNGDTITFTGTKRDGTPVTSTFSVAYTKPDGSQGTVQDLLDKLSKDFNCQASLDNAGRIVLTDNTADTLSDTSSLSVTGVSYAGNSGLPLPAGDSTDIFGTSAFATIPADVASQDGSEQGAVVTTSFVPEALSTTQYASSSTTIFQDQDGFASGFLQSVSTDVNGVITGNYSNGQVLKKAQVALASFSNEQGLSKQGGTMYAATTESGAPVTGAAGSNGLGSISPNSLEQSNVDLGVEFVNLITVQRGFQADSKIITTTDDMLNTLIQMKQS
jgi:flagellar hook-basal body protein